MEVGEPHAGHVSVRQQRRQPRPPALALPPHTLPPQTFIARPVEPVQRHGRCKQGRPGPVQRAATPPTAPWPARACDATVTPAPSSALTPCAQTRAGGLPDHADSPKKSGPRNVGVRGGRSATQRRAAADSRSNACRGRAAASPPRLHRIAHSPNCPPPSGFLCQTCQLLRLGSAPPCRGGRAVRAWSGGSGIARRQRRPANRRQSRSHASAADAATCSRPRTQPPAPCPPASSRTRARGVAAEARDQGQWETTRRETKRYTDSRSKRYTDTRSKRYTDTRSKRDTDTRSYSRLAGGCGRRPSLPDTSRAVKELTPAPPARIRCGRSAAHTRSASRRPWEARAAPRACSRRANPADGHCRARAGRHRQAQGPGRPGRPRVRGPSEAIGSSAGTSLLLRVQGHTAVTGLPRANSGGCPVSLPACAGRDTAAMGCLCRPVPASLSAARRGARSESEEEGGGKEGPWWAAGALVGASCSPRRCARAASRRVRLGEAGRGAGGGPGRGRCP